MIIILIDTREQNGPYIKRRLEAAGIESDIITFSQDTGCDYHIINDKGSCAVQRKVVCSEFITELDDMFDIAERLMAYSDNPVFLIEENFGITKDGYLLNAKDGRPTEMLATSYYGVLETLRKTGVDVQTTRDLNHSIWWMIAMHGYLAKNHYPKHRKYFSDKELAVGMLTCVAGVGVSRAEKALDKNSLRGMSGMKRIDGLTEKQSSKVGKVLRWRAE